MKTLIGIGLLIVICLCTGCVGIGMIGSGMIGDGPFREISIDIHPVGKEERGQRPRPLLTQADVAKILAISDEIAGRYEMKKVPSSKKDILSFYAQKDNGIWIRCIIHDPKRPQHLEVAIRRWIGGSSFQIRAPEKFRELCFEMQTGLEKEFGTARLEK